MIGSILITLYPQEKITVSGKGEEGRGLGLYIARQLLERIDYCNIYYLLK